MSADFSVSPEGAKIWSHSQRPPIFIWLRRAYFKGNYCAYLTRNFNTSISLVCLFILQKSYICNSKERILQSVLRWVDYRTLCMKRWGFPALCWDDTVVAPTCHLVLYKLWRWDGAHMPRACCIGGISFSKTTARWRSFLTQFLQYPIHLFSRAGHQITVLFTPSRCKTFAVKHANTGKLFGMFLYSLDNRLL